MATDGGGLTHLLKEFTRDGINEEREDSKAWIGSKSKRSDHEVVRRET